MSYKKRIVIGLSGASGIQIGISVLRAVNESGDWETHLVISDSAKRTLELESSGYSLEKVFKLADFVHDFRDIAACISSGTFKTEGMIVAPCSMKTIAGIVSGYSDNLLLRAADVTIKERRTLVLAARESPLSQIHLRNMTELSAMGAFIIPPLLTFYNNPETINDMLVHVTAKLLSPFSIQVSGFKPWREQND